MLQPSRFYSQAPFLSCQRVGVQGPKKHGSHDFKLYDIMTDMNCCRKAAGFASEQGVKAY
jgi:hypothetical protein